MKKLLLVFDGTHFSSSILDFSLQLHLQAPVQLIGIFLPSKDYVEAMSYFYYGNIIAPPYFQENEEDLGKIDQNIDRFNTFCMSHHIKFSIRKKNFYQNIAVSIQQETRFADLLLISSTRFYENLNPTIQQEYLKETVHKAECPILLLPEIYKIPERNIFAYDGSLSAMHAIKQFIYLLPHFADLETHIIYSDRNQKGIPNEEQIRNYAEGYFNSIACYDLNFNPEKYFSTWLENEKSPILICGAYGRNAVSELFHRNFILDVIREHKIPIFIAHQ